MKTRPMDTHHLGDMLSGVSFLHTRALCIFPLTRQARDGRIGSRERLRPAAGRKETFMAAVKIQGASPSPTSVRLDEILADSCARKAFDNLCSKGADRQELGKLVLHAIWLRGMRSYDPLSVSGLGRESLKKLPDDIRRIAEKITLVGENPDIDPPPALKQQFSRLPKTLRRYADNLQATIDHFRQFLQTHPRYYNLQVSSRRKLLRYIHKTTGRPHYARVASILSAAPLVGTAEPVVDSSSLRKIYPTGATRTATPSE